jgi:hypothetical protein
LRGLLATTSTATKYIRLSGTATAEALNAAFE